MTAMIDKRDYVSRQVPGVGAGSSPMQYYVITDPLVELAAIWSTATGSGTYYSGAGVTATTQTAYIDAITLNMGAGDYMRQADGTYVTVAAFRTAAKLAPIVAANRWDADAPAAVIVPTNTFLTHYTPGVMKTAVSSQVSQEVGLNSGPWSANAEQANLVSRTGLASWATNTLNGTLVATAMTTLRGAGVTQATMTTAIANIAAAAPVMGADPKVKFVLGAGTVGVGPDGFPTYPAPDNYGRWQPPAAAQDYTT